MPTEVERFNPLGITPEQAEKIREHNRWAHDLGATTYDDKQPYMMPSAVTEFQKDIRYLRSFFPKDSPRVLDLGCGTGFMTLAFAEQLCWVTSVDISSGMLAELRRKIAIEACTTLTASIQIVEEDVDKFLANTDALYDGIVFHSVLHHLPDYLETLKQACRRLLPGGFLYIATDPLNRKMMTPLNRWMARASELEEKWVNASLYRIRYLCERFWANSLPDAIQKAWRMFYASGASQRTPDSETKTKPDISLVEYHDVCGGIDEQEGIAVLKTQGLQILRSEKFCLYRHAWLTGLARSLRCPNVFKIIAHSTSSPIPVGGTYE